MGKRFKDKYSVREEKREKKKKLKSEKFTEVEKVVEESKNVEPLKITETQKIVKRPKKIKKKTGKKKLTFFLIVVCILVAPAIYFQDTEKNAGNTQNIITKVEENQVTEENKTEIVDADIPDTMGEYNVIGKIVIDKIGVAKNILDQTNDESLKLSVTKFYGPNVNEVGNLCLSGHNYKDTFGYLGKMQNGDTFYIVDKENFKKVTYKVYDQFTVNATELDCLEQETEGKREQDQGYSGVQGAFAREY